MKILMTGMVLQLQVMNQEETNLNMTQFILYRVWTMLIVNNFQLKSIDPIVPSSSTKCFYFDIDDVKYSDVHRNNFAPPCVRWRLMVNLNMASKTKHQRVRTKIDSGSDGNLLALSVYLSLFPGATHRSLLQSGDLNVSLYAYNGTEIQQLGHCKLRVSFKKP